MNKINVDLDTNSYDIHIDKGVASTLAKWIDSKKLSKRIFIVTNTTVADLYLNKFKAQFDHSFQLAEFICEDSESAKSLIVADEIFTDLIEGHFDRQSIIVALGGGVVGDLAGFVAATFLRSVPFIQIPTTLLAQVDSSVGGKVAVNHKLGKNLIGSFYQPKVVFIDPLFLKTLPKREIICGLAECVKYGYIWDLTLLNFIKNNLKHIFEHDLNVIESMIYNCIEIKKDIVEIDEKETGQRALLNFGHTFAHTLETADQYETIKHGEAVIAGMICALYASSKLHSDSIIFEQEKKFLNGLFHYLNTKKHSIQDLVILLSHDKKVENNEVKFIILKKIGTAYKRNLDTKLINDSFEQII